MSSVSQAKNIMHRAILQIVDPNLTGPEKNELWSYFDSRCAFCGEHIERATRTGHIGHLESTGGNGPRNRVLACARCNGDEKRDRPWREFLGEKCSNPEVLREQLERIEAWITLHPARYQQTSPEVEQAISDARRLVDEFHKACTRLREALMAKSM